MKRNLTTALGSVCCIAAMATIYFFPPSQYSFYLRCPIYATTHWLCPGCGGTRALHELLHLNISAALHYNALVTVMFPVLVLWFASRWYRSVREDSDFEFRIPVPFAVAFSVLAFVFTVARNTGLAFTI